MRQAVRMEWRKMRRLRTIPILMVLVTVVVALSSTSLFSESTRESFADPTTRPWAGLLLSYTLMAAMTSPILVAVLASRQTEIEHSGGGWILSATAGYSPGTLLRAKLAVLGSLVFVAVVLQTLCIVAAGHLAGIPVPMDVVPWTIYTGLLVVLNVAFLALHIWLAAVVDNQLISVGIGMLGAFVAVFSLLAPPGITRFVPWGYYAMISQVTATDRVVGYATAPYAWIAGFLVLAGIFFVAATRRFDRVEG
ncbi:MAG: ABC transporter permease [Tessaracoccus sp.]